MPQIVIHLCYIESRTIPVCPFANLLKRIIAKDRTYSTATLHIYKKSHSHPRYETRSRFDDIYIRNVRYMNMIYMNMRPKRKRCVLLVLAWNGSPEFCAIINIWDDDVMFYMMEIQYCIFAYCSFEECRKIVKEHISYSDIILVFYFISPTSCFA